MKCRTSNIFKVLGKDKSPFIPLQKANALYPIRVTPSGIINDPLIFIQFENARSEIASSLSGSTRYNNDDLPSIAT